MNAFEEYSSILLYIMLEQMKRFGPKMLRCDHPMEATVKTFAAVLSCYRFDRMDEILNCDLSHSSYIFSSVLSWCRLLCGRSGFFFRCGLKFYHSNEKFLLAITDNGSSYPLSSNNDQQLISHLYCYTISLHTGHENKRNDSRRYFPN